MRCGSARARSWPARIWAALDSSAQILPALGHPTIGLIEAIKPPELYDFFARQRQGQNFRIVPVGSSGLRELIRALRHNDVVGMVTDREFGGANVVVSFFDYPTRFAEGVAALSLRTGAWCSSASAPARGRPLRRLDRAAAARVNRRRSDGNIRP